MEFSIPRVQYTDHTIMKNVVFYIYIYKIELY